jgi:SAM-dependent methyltransferase
MNQPEPDRRTTAFAASAVPESYEHYLAAVLFGPWAEILLDTVGVRPGDQVLDVASGTGVVARLAAAQGGKAGRVVASDVSSAMLTHAATVPSPVDAAPIEYLEASVTELPLEDASFDVVLCQQGMPFFTDRTAAAAEMLRVLRPSGKLGLSVWLAGRPLEPFDHYIEVLAEAGIPPPFPGAFDSETFKMSTDEVQTVLEGAGLRSLRIHTIEHEVSWPNAESAARGILGTPFAPLIDQLSPDRRETLEAALLTRFSPSEPGEPVRRTTTAVVACGSAPGSS